jgi:hypothetical protein
MNPATLQLISMILGAVLNIVPKVQEDTALKDQWVAFCKKIIDEARDPTADEEAAALAFANAEHEQVQQS